jgi:uncharacterized protein YbjT (DUF2867 family)
MRVLLTGASGFIGRHLAAELERCGHVVVCAVRFEFQAPPRACDSAVSADFARDVDVLDWVPRLGGIDAVINAVGIIRERGTQTFERLHALTPCALFDACVIAGVQRVVNISALGADENARSGYHLSKRRADTHLRSLPLTWTIVQPSLVYGPDGTSARLFTMLASLPLIPVPGRGTQRVQPIHIDDLTAGIVALLESPSANRATVPFVGPSPLGLRDFLALLRGSMRLPRARFLYVPLSLVRTAARVSSFLPAMLLDTDTLSMLLRGNVADPAPVQVLLGRPTRPANQFIKPHEVDSVRTRAQLAWLLPMLRVSIATVWIVTGIVSLGLFPAEQSYQLLYRVGVPANLAPLFLYGAAALDLALGLGTLLLRRRRVLWITQAALILGYTAIITLRLPEFWLHPYGPLLKNVPMLAAIALLYALERR